MESDDHLCSLALVAIGKIGHRLPHLVHADLALIQSSFDSLATATGEKLSALQVGSRLNGICRLFTAHMRSLFVLFVYYSACLLNFVTVRYLIRLTILVLLDQSFTMLS